MFKIKLYLIAVCLALATSVQAYETITVGNLEVQLLGAGESASSFDIVFGESGNESKLFDGTITGASVWSEEQKNAIRRSLEVIDQSFDTGTPHRKFEIAMALQPLGPGVLGVSMPTSYIDKDYQNVVSTGELLLRDNIDVGNIFGSVDDTILFSSKFPFDASEGNTSSQKYDFQAVVTHEILHSLGIMSPLDSDGSLPWGNTRWSSLLKDIYGNSITNISTTGELGTVFWTGEYANATYGGQVPIQTFLNEYISGSTLSHPGTYGEMMSWSGVAATGARSINKLLLDMYRDMGWSINEAYYDSFGPTNYSENGKIDNTTDFTTTHSYTYGLYVNGSNNTIEQNSYLKVTQEQSQALSLTGHFNTLNINGQQIAEGNFSQAVKVYGNANLIQTHQDNEITAQGTESAGIYLSGYKNTLIHSGKITASLGAEAIRVENFWALYDIGVNTNVYIQNGAEVIGDIVNGDTSSFAGISFGKNYGDDLIYAADLIYGDVSYSADHNFAFTFNDDFIGNWNYDFHAGTVTLAKTLTLQESGVIMGNGTVVGNVESNGLIAPGNSVGTLTINGDLTQSSTSNVEIEFDENGYDQLNVSGTVNLDGALTLVPLGYITPGTYQFLDAGTVNGSFATVNNFLSAVLETSSSSPDSFTLARNSYLSVTENSFAASLDKARLTATGDMADILNQFDLMSVADLKSATDDLSPHIYNSVTTANLEAVQNRSSFLRNKMKSESQDESSPLWFSGYNGKTHYVQMSTSDEFTAQQAGFMLGGTKSYTTGFNLGGAASFTDLDLNEENTTSSSSGSIYDVYLYGAWTPQIEQSFYIQAILGAGCSDFDTDREITFLNRVASSDQDATYFSAFVGGGYNYTTGNWSIEPRVGLEYIFLDEDSFNETGADSLSLSVDSKESDAVISSIGVNVSHNFQFEKSILVPNLSVDWFHNFSNSTNETTGELQSGENYSVDGRNAGEDAIEIGVGLKIIASDLVHGYVDYQYTFADEQDRSYLISAGLSYNF